MSALVRPTVSVIIPTYNHAHFLSRALTSVKSQTFSDWEAVVVNNFSTDNTIEIVESFQDSRIKLINFANGGVIAAARNKGIASSLGEYIAFLDSDDFWFPEKLSKCLELFRKENADIVCHAEAEMRNGVKQRSLVYGPEKNAEYSAMVFKGNCLSTSAVIVKKKCLDQVGSFMEEKSHNTAEDYDLWLRLSQAGFKIKFIAEELGEYLLHDSNNSGAVDTHFQAILVVTKKHFGNFNDTIINKIKKRLRIGVLYYGAARHSLALMQPQLSIKYLWQSLKLNPFYVKSYVTLLQYFVKKVSS